MKSSSTAAMQLAAFALGTLLASGAMAQQGTPVGSTAATTSITQPAGSMSKSDIKKQRKQQKKDEAAAKANAGAAKAQAKSKEANDKALQSEEKAGETTNPPAGSTPPQL
jgi:hypothetical protein